MTKVKTVYLSGELSKENLDKFYQSENLLTTAGFKVINPAALLNCVSKRLTSNELMEFRTVLLLQCDSIYLLKDFYKSDDAKLELKLAEKNNMEIMREGEYELDELVQEALLERYPKGTKIKLIKMVNDPFPVKPGTIGIVESVDDAGTIHMHWQSGSSLGLIPGIDEFEILEEEK